jgi:hypothetical protein
LSRIEPSEACIATAASLLEGIIARLVSVVDLSRVGKAAALSRPP